MSKFQIVWGLYYTSMDRTWGTSEFYDTCEQALNAKIENFNGECRIEMQTYELEEDQHHDCGDDE